MIATLALGFGVNTAVATVAWSVLLRPMPIADPDRVVLDSAGSKRCRMSWRRRSASSGIR